MENGGVSQPVAKPSGVRKSTLVISIVIALFAGYVLGMRHDETMMLFGQDVSGGKINFSEAQEVYDNLVTKYDGTIDTAAVVDGANKGVAASAGDPYTQYFNAEEAKEFSEALHGEVSGIGVVISKRNDAPTIVRVIDDSPAQKAGIKAFDVIAKVGDEDVLDMTVDEVATKIRGESGTSVKLTVVRNGEEKEFSVVRAEVKDPSVASEINNGVGIITVRRFEGETAGLVRQAAQKMKDQKVKGVILDLRDNTGGEVSSAQAVAGVWLDNKVVMIEKSKNAPDENLYSTGTPLLNGVKTVILSNGSSASASEIVIGALRDHGVATSLGEKTYGKGSMQQVIDLSGGGQLKVTIAHWFTPNNSSINGTGIEPDKKVGLTAEDLDANKDPQMAAALTEFN